MNTSFSRIARSGLAAGLTLAVVGVGIIFAGKQSTALADEPSNNGQLTRRGLSGIVPVEGRPRAGECLGVLCGPILCEFDEAERCPGLGGLFTVQFGYGSHQPQPCQLVVTTAVGRQAGAVVGAARIDGPGGAAARRDAREAGKNGRLER